MIKPAKPLPIPATTVATSPEMGYSLSESDLSETLAHQLYIEILITFSWPKYSNSTQISYTAGLKMVIMKSIPCT